MTFKEFKNTEEYRFADILEVCVDGIEVDDNYSEKELEKMNVVHFSCKSGWVSVDLNNNYFEAVEICPYCMSENVYPMWDVEKSGFVAVCEHCGNEILLCDECLHMDDNNARNCDWCETECGGKCHRGETRE